MKKPKQVKTTFATYTLDKLLGQGGAGIVYAAIEDGGSPVAIKMLRTNSDSQEKLKRFKNEYIFCSRNTHANIISVLDHGIAENGAPFFVMPLYEGSLRDVIGKLTPKDAFKIFEKILNGIDAAHKLGTIHRDLKPENILINGIDTDLVIADFGIAEFEQDEIYTSVETKDGTRLGNFQYAAPEQRVRGKKIDKRADIYALGLILNELFTNELAHGTGYKIIESVAKEYSYLDPIVNGMLHHDPASRYPDIDELKKELIARGAEHVSMQKISTLKGTVIPISDIDDPLAIDPMKIVGVDWDDGHLSIRLNHYPNPAWLSALRNMGNYTSVRGKEPDSFNFSGDFGGGYAKIQASKDEVQQVIDYFNQWLLAANSLYVIKIKRDLAETERKRREEIQRKIKQEQERAEVMRNIKY
jgi:serine/threonine protein kinase